MSRKAISIFCGLVLIAFFTSPIVAAYEKDTHKTLTRCMFGCTKMLRIFDKSDGVCLWNRGNKVGSMDELGRALHYMQDLCCVVHSRSWKSNFLDLATHMRYEKDMDRDRDKHLYTIVDLGKLNFNFRGSEDVRYTANFYSNQINDCYKGASTKATFEEFEIAYKASCELVYLFFKECGRPL